MALIKCTECGKEISDKAERCPNCGYPIKDILGIVNTDKKSSNNNYKKFDFNNNEVDLDNPKFMEYHNQEAKTDLKSSFKISIISFIIAFLGLLVSMAGNHRGFAVAVGGFMLLSGFLVSVIYIIKAIISYFSIGSKNSLEHKIEKLRYQYYANNMKTFSTIPPDLNYEVISSINARSKNELLHEAYSLKADALINVNIQKYTSSDTQSHFNGIGAKPTIRTKVSEHENWTADAIIISSENYHAPFRKINEHGSIEFN